MGIRGATKSTTMFIAAFLAVVAQGAEMRWSDAQSGTQFLYLPGEGNFRDAHRKCTERGWDVFNYTYLSPEEQKRFLASSELRQMGWRTRFGGEPGEHRSMTVWMSSEGNTITHNMGPSSIATLELKHFRNEATPRLRVPYSRMDVTGNQILCMYQSHTWEGCSHQLTCKYEQADGGTMSIRHVFYEYGPHRSVALSRIRERAKNWHWDVGAKCELAAQDPTCIVYR